MQSKRPSGVFSNTTVQKHQFFGAQLSLYMSHHLSINRQHLLPALGPWLCYQAAGHFLLLLVHHCAHSEAHQRQRGPWSAGIGISDPSSAEPLKTYFGDGRNELVWTWFERFLFSFCSGPNQMIWDSSRQVPLVSRDLQSIPQMPAFHSWSFP